MAIPSNDFTCTTGYVPSNDFSCTPPVPSACVATSWNLLVEVEGCVDTTWNLTPEATNCVATEWDLVTQVSQCVDTTWTLPLGPACVSTDWRLAATVNTCVATDWSLVGPDVVSCTDTTWTLIGGDIVSCVDIQWQLLGPDVLSCKPTSWIVKADAIACVATTWRLPEDIVSCIPTTWELDQFPDIISCKNTTYSLLAPALTVCDDTIEALTLDGTIEFCYDSVSISGDMDSFVYSANITTSDKASWDLIVPNFSILTFNIAGTQFQFRALGKERTIDRASRSYTIYGTTPTSANGVELDKRITQNFAGQTLSSAMTTIAAEIGETISYQIEDVTIPAGQVDLTDARPLEAIQELADRMGAHIQPEADGTAFNVKYRYRVPTTLFDVSPVVGNVSELQNIFSATDKWQYEPLNDSITISDIPGESGEISISFTSTIVNGQVCLRADVVPFQTITLQDHGLGAFDITFEGEVIETVTDDCLQVIDGKTNLTRPFLNEISHVYSETDLGALTISESGEVTTALANVSILSVTYQTRYLSYKVANPNSLDKALIFTETC